MPERIIKLISSSGTSDIAHIGNDSHVWLEPDGSNVLVIVGDDMGIENHLELDVLKDKVISLRDQLDELHSTIESIKAVEIDHVEVWKNARRQWFVRAVARNGQTVFSAESNGYVRKRDALAAAKVFDKPIREVVPGKA